jgi:hypothetical protein
MYTSNEIATNWLSQTGNDSPTQEEITSARTQLDNMRKLTLLRLRRDQLIKDTDWWTVSDRTISQAELDYRQALRDITDVDLSTVDLNEQGDLIFDNWPTNPNIVVDDPFA